RRALPRPGAHGGHTRGGPAALSAHPDDHAGGAVQRHPAHAGHRLRRGTAAAAGAGHGRRTAVQPDPDAIHHAGHLSYVRSLRQSRAAGPRRPARAPRRPRRRRQAAAMRLFTLFIMRPVTTTLVCVALVLAGGLSFALLPVAPLPQVDFPMISVT